MCTLKCPILLKCLCLLILNTYLQADKSMLLVSIYKLPSPPHNFLFAFNLGAAGKIVVL